MARRRRKTALLLGFHRILVPLGADPESDQAVDVACRLAAERGASITLLVVIEVPALLPLDAHMLEEEAEARRLLDRAIAIAESYGLSVAPRSVRARDAASAIVAEATIHHIEMLVVGTPRNVRAGRAVAMFGSTVEHVLRRAPCRVTVIGTTAESPATTRNAAA
jgi:nucleotide-binding universal stress UspA family protein